MNHAVFISILALLACSAFASADKVDEIVAKEMRRQRIPGVSLAVVFQGKVVKSAGYGYANLEWKIRATDKTVYQIQSTTKTFTSAAVMMLVQEGKVSVDDKIAKYIDNVPETWKDVTLGRLLTHTSGIKDFINEPVTNLRLEMSEQEVFDASKGRPMNFQPGDRYEYSNTNYSLLAMVIRKVTGMSYGEFLRERVFKPLQMKDTLITNLSNIVPNRASGYVSNAKGEVVNGLYISESVLAYAGGGIMSTVLDLAKWDLALYGNALLSDESKRATWSPTKLNSGVLSGYGFGWAIGKINGHTMLAHSGGHMTGFATIFMRFPDEKLSVIVFTNAQFAAADRIARQVAATYVPALSEAPEKVIKDTDPKVRKLVRTILTQGAQDKLDMSLFTEQMKSVFTPEFVHRGSASLAMMGKIKKLELLNRVEDKNLRMFRYRVTLENGVIRVGLAVNAEGKVAGFEMNAG